MTESTRFMSNENESEGADEADLEALRDAVSRVLETKADRLALHAYIDRENQLDRTLWTQAAELGWLSVGLAEEQGGMNLGARGLDVLYRELGARAAPGPFIACLAAAQTLDDVADAPVRAEWLPRLATGESKLAVAANLRDDSTGWLLGDVDSDVALVPLDGDHWGLVPVMEAEPVKLWDRTRSVVRAGLRTGEPAAILSGSDTARALTKNIALAIAGDSVAGARAILTQTVAYMKEREQFGRPIASFQALKHRVADLMTGVVSGEEIVSLATEAVDAGMPDAEMWATLAKTRATETFLWTATECLQLHGGVGFTWEFDVHIYLNRARLNEMLLAPNTTMKDDAAANLAAAFRAGRQPLELPL